MILELFLDQLCGREKIEYFPLSVQLKTVQCTLFYSIE